MTVLHNGGLVVDLCGLCKTGGGQMMRSSSTQSEARRLPCGVRLWINGLTRAGQSAIMCLSRHVSYGIFRFLTAFTTAYILWGQRPGSANKPVAVSRQPVIGEGATGPLARVI